MIKHYLLALAFSLTILACQVQKQSTTSQNQTLFTIGDSEVYSEDFKYAFLKNFRPSDSTSIKDEVTDYLDLYVKFKLKVLEAQALGYADRESYKAELAKYQKDLAKPYLTESKVTEELIRETYDRLGTEIKASHILASSGQRGATQDTMKAYQKIVSIQNMIAEGHDFDSLARAMSDDPSAKTNAGNLGYFTALQMVYPFENAAFKTAVGEVSDPVKTRFGYHLVKVNDKRTARGKLRVAHIMIRTPQNQSVEEGEKSKGKIDAIYDEVKSGKDWAQLVIDYSEDPGSKQKDGELPWFGTGNFVPEFEEVAFTLDSTNNISKPFKTVYGWHIIKFLEKKGLESFDVLKPEIEKRVSRDSRSQVKEQVVLERLKKENDFVKYQENINQVIKGIESDSLSVDLEKLVLFSISGNNISGNAFKEFVESAGNDNIQSLYNQFEKQRILDFENELLEDKYPEYRALYSEYREGILLFDVMEERVWQKASQDTTGLTQFYNENKVAYRKENVVLADIYTAKQRMITDKVDSLLSQGKEKSEIDEILNADDPLTLQIRSGNYSKGDNTLIDRNVTVGIHRYSENGRFYLLNIKGSKAEVYPELEEIKGRVISDYQDHLESEWVAELRKKYPVKLNDKALEKVIDEIESKY